MNIKKSALMLSLAAAMALLNTTVFAIDLSSSEVIKTTGKVSVKKTNSPEFKKLNSNLKLSGSLKKLNGGDKVRTYTNSTADLALKDTCILVVKEQSIFEVPQVLTNKDKINLKAQQGSILFKVAKGSNFQVQTSDAICGVKGTMFSVTVVDGLNTMLETPGLQVGYAFTGATDINVYEGEVEVINKNTNKKTTLKAGQGLVACKNIISGLNEIINFDPKAKLLEQFGKIGGKSSEKLVKLLNCENLKLLSDLDLSGDIASKLGISSKLTESLGKLNASNPLANIIGPEKLYAIQSGINEAESITNIASDLKGKDFQADFSNYPILKEEKYFTSNNYDEAYLGNNTFVVAKAANGSHDMATEPGLSGLVVTQGNGLIKMQVLNSKAKVTGEILANIYESGNDVITVIRNNDGKLSWRTPGSLEIAKVPTGDAAYIYNKKTSKGKWAVAAPGSISDELVATPLSVNKDMATQKKAVEEENTQKRIGALKSINSRYNKDSEKQGTINNLLNLNDKEGKKKIQKELGNKVKDKLGKKLKSFF